MRSNAAHSRGHHAATRAALENGTPVHVLEHWLCDPALPAPTLDDLSIAFGVSFEPRDTAASECLASRLRLSLAILRDVFPTDDAIRRWLRAPGFYMGGDRPLDLLLAGHAERLEQCAVREWNRVSQSFTSFGDDQCP